MSDKILAVCAGHEITEKEVKDLIANYPPEQQIYLSSPQAKDELVEQLIGFHLFSKMAEENKIKESKEYKETLAKMENELASHMAEVLPQNLFNPTMKSKNGILILRIIFCLTREFAQELVGAERVFALAKTALQDLS